MSLIGDLAADVVETPRIAGLDVITFTGSFDFTVAKFDRDGTLLMTTMRAANEVRAPEFRDAGGDVDERGLSSMTTAARRCRRLRRPSS